MTLEIEDDRFPDTSLRYQPRGEIVRLESLARARRAVRP
jgi:hypothetical protein